MGSKCNSAERLNDEFAASISVDFDTELDRRSSESLKWHRHPSDVLPMFVADMDFLSPTFIAEALKKRVAHGCFGYASAPASVKEVVCSMLQNSYGWKVEPDWLVFLPGLVSALAMAARMTARERHKVIVPTPCYPPFAHAPHYMDCETIFVPLKCEKFSTWSLDLKGLDKAADEGGRTLLLCNPQNPTGHVFRHRELEELASWAKDREVTIVSDEIHCGLILDEDLHHIPVASLDEATASRTITLMAPSKTFNVPGIGVSFAVVPNAHLRKRFEREGEDIVPPTNLFGYTVCEAAYLHGEPWRRALVRYLRANRDIIIETLKPYSSLVQVNCPEATYLSWMNFSNCGWENPASEILKRGRVALGIGADFHDSRCARLTFGCPRSTLEEGLRRITKVLDEVG